MIRVYDAGPKDVVFHLRGDPYRVREVIAQTLEGDKYKITWLDPWSAVVERGSVTGNVLLGGFAQHLKFALDIRAASVPGQLVVRIDRGSAPWVGGMIGIRRTKKAAESLRDQLRDAFRDAGMLISQAEE